MNKKSLSEQDICSKYILPAITNAGWDLKYQIREQVSFTAGKILVRGKSVSRGEQKRADFILYYKNEIPLAIIEAKDNNHTVGSGMQQGLGYAEILDIPFVFSSNGDAFIEHDRLITSGLKERELSLDAFPSPEKLYERYKIAKGINKKIETVISQDYYQDIGGKSPRYFQSVAINRTVEAVAREQKRILLVMTTGVLAQKNT
jgi:type I restriction enzyme R subunit